MDRIPVLLGRSMERYLSIARNMNYIKAVIIGSRDRLRPILMTTAAMVLGVLPLVTASGAGAVGRFNMGLVISTGIAIGTLFTLFVVPAMYMLLGAEHAGQRTPETVSDTAQDKA